MNNISRKCKLHKYKTQIIFLLSLCFIPLLYTAPPLSADAGYKYLQYSLNKRIDRYIEALEKREKINIDYVLHHDKNLHYAKKVSRKSVIGDIAALTFGDIGKDREVFVTPHGKPYGYVLSSVEYYITDLVFIHKKLYFALKELLWYKTENIEKDVEIEKAIEKISWYDSFINDRKNLFQTAKAHYQREASFFLNKNYEKFFQKYPKFLRHKELILKGLRIFYLNPSLEKYLEMKIYFKQFKKQQKDQFPDKAILAFVKSINEPLFEIMRKDFRRMK